MRILNSQENHFQPTDMLFGPSKIKAVIVFLVLTGLFSILLVVTFQDRQWVPFALISFFCVITLLGMGSWVVKAFKKDSWKIVIQNSAILLKADIVQGDSQGVLEIQFHEISSLRKIKEKYIRYKGGRNHTKPTRFDSLDIQLAPAAYTQLEMLVGSGVRGLEMIAPNRFIYPTGIHMLSVDKIICHLKTHCRIQESETIRYEMPDLKDKQQVNNYILFLTVFLNLQQSMFFHKDSHKENLYNHLHIHEAHHIHYKYRHLFCLQHILFLYHLF